MGGNWDTGLDSSLRCIGQSEGATIPILSLVADLCFGTTRVVDVVTQLTKQSKYVAVWLNFAMHGFSRTPKLHIYNFRTIVLVISNLSFSEIM